MLRVTLTLEDHSGLEAVAHALRAGGVGVVPTDTLYGFSARYDRPSAIRRIAAIKGRGAMDPFLVLIATDDQLELLTDAPPHRAIIDLLWPGPVTLLLHGRPGLAPGIRGSAGTVAVRWPRAPLVHALLAAAGVPLISTSVNRHGKRALADPDLIAREFGAAIDVLADAGARGGAAPSTIVDLTRRPPVLVRQGAQEIDIERLGLLLDDLGRAGGGDA